jgi:hypothetical protein
MAAVAAMAIARLAAGILAGNLLSTGAEAVYDKYKNKGKGRGMKNKKRLIKLLMKNKGHGYGVKRRYHNVRRR